MFRPESEGGGIDWEDDNTSEPFDESLTNHSRSDYDYRIFDEKQARDEIFAFSKSIAEYIKTNKVKDLVIVDRSSRPLYIGVMEYWKATSPDLPMPRIYFVNPKGFKSSDELSEFELMVVDTEAHDKDDPLEGVSRARTKPEVIKEFKDAYPKLLADKDEPILIFDTCIHSGDTLFPVVEVFKELGFSDFRIGSINPPERGSKIETDFYVTQERPEVGCYPYGRDRMIEKTFEHVYSKPSTALHKQKAGRELRREIRQIMLDGLSDRGK